MSENSYRLLKAILLAAAVFGFLIICWEWSQNGRYQQMIIQDGQTRPQRILDTRNGVILEVNWGQRG